MLYIFFQRYFVEGDRGQRHQGLSVERAADGRRRPRDRRGRPRRRCGDFYFNSWRFVPANLIWGATAVALWILWIVAAGRDRARAAPRASPPPGSSGSRRWSSAANRRRSGTGCGVWRTQARSSWRSGSPSPPARRCSSSNIAVGLASGSFLGWAIATLAAWGALAPGSWRWTSGRSCSTRRGRTCRSSVRLRTAGLLVLAFPVRLAALGGLLAVVVLASTRRRRGPAVRCRVAFAALVATRFTPARGGPPGGPAGRCRRLSPRRSRDADRPRRRSRARAPGVRDDGPVRLPIPVGPDTVTINRDDRVLVCQQDGRIDAAPKRVLRPRHPLRVGLRPDRQRPAAGAAQLVVRSSSSRPASSSRTRRSLDDVGPIAAALPRRSASTGPSAAASTRTTTSSTTAGARSGSTIEIEIASDFADIFDVKAGQLVRRGSLNSRWFRSRGELRTVYDNRDFHRELIIAVDRAGLAAPVRQRAPRVHRVDRARRASGTPASAGCR